MTQHGDTADDTRERLEVLYANREFELLHYRLKGLPPSSRGKLQAIFTNALLADTMAVATPAGPLSFVMLGRKTAGRASTLLTKQPGTIDWINSFRTDSVFWDVGANIGVYALYAALRGGTKVVAFEPAAVNYFLLAANCEANRLDASVDCLQVGLGGERALARLEVSQFGPAQSFSFRPKDDRQLPSRQAALILPMDQLIDDYGVPCPTYVKIDAPGMTQAIIAGGSRTLQRREVRQIHVELNDQSQGGRQVVEMLRTHGFGVVSRHPHGGSMDVTFARPGE